MTFLGRFNLIASTIWTMETDGINYLSYKVVSTTRQLLYTNVTTDVGKWPC